MTHTLTHPTASTERPLAGQRALVTGATGGLGSAIAQELAGAGAELILLGRDRERGARVLEQVEQAGTRGRFISADLSDAGLIARIAGEIGDVDILVNNAGFSLWGATHEIAPEDFDAMFAANVRGPYYLVAAFAPGMAERGHGSIINIGSMAGTVGLTGGAAYGATKAAIDGLTRSWAAEYGASGVRVNTVAPGPIYTRPEARELFDQLGATTALKRASEPQEIAALVGFLAGPGASYVTGATLAADGGRTAI
jgi:NAD(P)-dependent dehydrogenase (short-subunit alcohol dehydrogenase family)